MSPCSEERRTLLGYRPPAPPLSPEEREVVARFEAAPDALLEDERHLSYEERAVALALYRHGGGTLRTDAFIRALEVDPLAQRVAREATPVLGRLAKQLSGLLSNPFGGA